MAIGQCNNPTMWQRTSLSSTVNSTEHLNNIEIKTQADYLDTSFPQERESNSPPQDSILLNSVDHQISFHQITVNNVLQIIIMYRIITTQVQ